MTLDIIWWILAIGLGLAELLTAGTFYLLILAVGCAAGGVAAWLGLPLVMQILVAATVAVAGWFVLSRRRARQGKALPASDNPDVLLDVGGHVNVEQWTSARATQVRYRGAMWSVELDDHEADGLPGDHVIRRVRGSSLIVGRRPILSTSQGENKRPEENKS